MALQSSGKITLKEIAAEFGGDAPHGLKEYYRGGAYTTGNNTNVAVSPNLIGLKQFYSATNQFEFTVSTSQQEMNLATYATAQGWDGTAPVVMTVASGVYLWSDNTSVGGLTIPSSMNGLVTITNNGYIIGRGGDAGQAGGPALVNNATGVILTNASGAFIAGGGGGGGGRGGGGAGGGNGVSGYRESPPTSYAAGVGGAIGQNGTNGESGAYSGGSYDGAGLGGGAGGGGAGAEPRTDGYAGYGASGGGGRVLTVSTSYGQGAFGGLGDGGTGGSNGNAGSNGTYGGGGGGWGAAGGNSGGAGGAAISGTAIATYTNNGTVYGTTA